MENASKALLIAGGVLIAMVVASFGVYLYSVYHEHSENMLDAMSEKEVTEFNAKFSVYTGKTLVINDVISLMNFVRENKGTIHEVEMAGSLYRSTNPNGFILKNYINQNDTEQYNKSCQNLLFIYSKLYDDSGNIVNAYEFACEIDEYSNTGYVKKITIKTTKHP